MDRIRVFLENMAQDVRKDDIEKEFSVYGKLVKVYFLYDQPGTGFVDFIDPGDAEFAAKSMDGVELYGRRLRTKLTRGTLPPNQGSNRNGRFDDRKRGANYEDFRDRDRNMGSREKRFTSSYDEDSDRRKYGRFDDYGSSKSMSGRFDDSFSSRESRERVEFRDSRGSRGTYGYRESRETRGSFDMRDLKGYKDSFGYRNSGGDSREMYRPREFHGRSNMSGYNQDRREGTKNSFSQRYDRFDGSYTDNSKNDYYYDDQSYGKSYSHYGSYMHEDGNSFSPPIKRSADSRSHFSSKESYREIHSSRDYVDNRYRSAPRKSARSRSPISRGSSDEARERHRKHLKSSKTMSEKSLPKSSKNRSQLDSSRSKKRSSSSTKDERYSSSMSSKRRNPTSERY